MPKTKANARPYNRTQKRAAKRNKKVLESATKAGLGKATYSGTGPGRRHTSPGVSAQATRSLALKAAKEKLRKTKKKK